MRRFASLIAGFTVRTRIHPQMGTSTLVDGSSLPVSSAEAFREVFDYAKRIPAEFAPNIKMMCLSTLNVADCKALIRIYEAQGFSKDDLSVVIERLGKVRNAVTVLANLRPQPEEETENPFEWGFRPTIELDQEYVDELRNADWFGVSEVAEFAGNCLDFWPQFLGFRPTQPEQVSAEDQSIIRTSRYMTRLNVPRGMLSSRTQRSSSLDQWGPLPNAHDNLLRLDEVSDLENLIHEFYKICINDAIFTPRRQSANSLNGRSPLLTWLESICSEAISAGLVRDVAKKVIIVLRSSPIYKTNRSLSARDIFWRALPLEWKEARRRPNFSDAFLSIPGEFRFFQSFIVRKDQKEVVNQWLDHMTDRPFTKADRALQEPLLEEILELNKKWNPDKTRSLLLNWTQELVISIHVASPPEWDVLAKRLGLSRSLGNVFYVAGRWPETAMESKFWKRWFDAESLRDLEDAAADLSKEVRIADSLTHLIRNVCVRNLKKHDDDESRAKALKKLCNRTKMSKSVLSDVFGIKFVQVLIPLLSAPTDALHLVENALMRSCKRYTIGKLIEGREPLCAICQDDMTSDDVTHTEACIHNFHEPCLSAWLKRSVLCPLCKKELPEVF